MEYSKLQGLVGTDWADFLKGFMCPGPTGTCDYDRLSEQLKKAYSAGPVYPEMKQVFRCFKETPLSAVRVIVLGQDPYAKAGYANGLAFATDNPVLPISLKQIYDAIEKDAYNGLDTHKPSRTGVLAGPSGKTWTSQGVLLLNTSLTVEADKPDSHADIWKPFTDYVISNLWRVVKRHLIFIGWGVKAKQFLNYTSKGTDSFGSDGFGAGTGVNIFHASILTAEHPAAAARAKRVWATDNFSKCNLIIRINQLGAPIEW